MLATQLELKKELEETKKKLEKANKELYDKTWQLEYAYRMLERIMKRESPDEFSLNLLLLELSGYVAK